MNKEFKKALEAFKMFPNSSIAKKNLLNELDKLKEDLGRRKNKKYTGQKLGDILSPYTGSEFAEEANDFLRAASEDLNEAKNDLFDMKSELFEEIRDVRKKMQKDIERQKQKIRQDINKRKGFPPPPPIPPKPRTIPNVTKNERYNENRYSTTSKSIGQQLDDMMDKESKVLYGDIMKGHSNRNQQKFHHESMDEFQKRVKIQTKLRCQVLFDDDSEYYVLDFLHKPLVRVDDRHEILGEDYEILKKNDNYFTNEDINAVVEAKMPISSWFFKTFWPSEVAVMKIKIKKSNIKLEPDEKENDVE